MSEQELREEVASDREFEEFCQVDTRERITDLISRLSEYFSDTDIEIKDVTLTYNSEGLYSVCVIWSIPGVTSVMGRTVYMDNRHGLSAEDPPKSMAELRAYFHTRIAVDAEFEKKRERERREADGAD